MTTRRSILLSGAAALVAWFASSRAQSALPASNRFPVSWPDAEWRQRLTPKQYAILRGHGTERPYSSALNNEHRRGTFVCAGCEAELFASSAKYDSRTGWPSFWMPIDKHAVGESVGPTAWCARKSTARAAAVIWATCFPTARRPRACAIA